MSCSHYQSAARGGRVELDERCSLAESFGAEQAEIESLDYFVRCSTRSLSRRATGRCSTYTIGDEAVPVRHSMYPLCAILDPEVGIRSPETHR